MLDARLIRSDPEGVRAALARRGDEGLLDPVIGLDEERRALQAQVDELRARRNAVSEQVGQAKRRAKDDPQAAAEADRLSQEIRDLKEGLGGLEERLRTAEGAFREALLQVPNLPHPSAPLGAAEEDAEVVKVVGAKPDLGFAPRDHMELAGGWIDMERGARTSGSRFGYLVGDVALLWMGIQRYAVSTLVERGFTPINPPVLVREGAMYGTGFFPTDRASVYLVSGGADASREEELFLVGTSEVSIAAFHLDEILAEGDLPLRYCGISACFRREAGAAGRDTRGIFRTHQFEKVEMFSFQHPDRSWEEHDRMLAVEEELAQGMGLHYRVVNIAAGDLGASAAKKYDIEVWLPGQDRYRELTSCSNCTDYQARRLNTRYRPTDGGAPRTVHTLNGTAVTSSRTVIAVLETHQREDGTVAVPEVLVRHGAPAVIEPRG